MKNIFSPKALSQSLTRLYLKALSRGNTFDLTQDEIPIYALTLFSNSFLRALYQDIQQHHYVPGPVQTHTISKYDKDRTVVNLKPIDHIIQSCLVNKLNQHYFKQVLPSVHSYIPGRNNYTAIKAFSTYLKQQPADVYVLRSDITNYTNNIPLHSRSTLWPRLEALLHELPLKTKDLHYLQQLIKQMIQPELISEENTRYCNIRGVPMGNPLTTLIAIMYLREVDEAFTHKPGLFYLRFGDDIILAHHNEQQLLSYVQIYDDLLNILELSRNPQKDQLLYFTRGGIPHRNDIWKATHKIEYVGYKISKNGTIGLSRLRYRSILTLLKTCINNAANTLHGADTTQQCQTYCLIVNQLITPFAPLYDKRIDYLYREIDDRQQLKQLDYQIALMIAKQVSQQKGVKAFRKISYRMLRDVYGLNSLVQIKNSNQFSQKMVLN